MILNNLERKILRALSVWAVACTRHSYACEISRRVSRGSNYYPENIKPENIKNAEEHVDETREKLLQAEGELLNAFSAYEEAGEEECT